MLALMYFLIIDHKASRYTVNGLLDIYEIYNVVVILFML